MYPKKMVFKLFIFIPNRFYLKKNLLKKNLFLNLKEKIEFRSALWVKLISILKFLNSSSISIPIENSSPASASKKNDREYKFISSFMLPQSMDNVYKITHTSSEKRIIDKKLKLLMTNINIDIQKIVFQKINQDCTLARL